VACELGPPLAWPRRIRAAILGANGALLADSRTGFTFWWNTVIERRNEDFELRVEALRIMCVETQAATWDPQLLT